jgi:hypothetical protein
MARSNASRVLACRVSVDRRAADEAGCAGAKPTEGEG